MKDKNLFHGNVNMIEHTLCIHADSYAFLPADAIYNDQAIERIKHVTDNCHIYIIGETPIISTIDIFEDNNDLCFTISIDNRINEVVRFPIPDGFKFVTCSDCSFVENSIGEKRCPTDDQIITKLVIQSSPLPFEIKYIGQAYGNDGKRNAIDRLKKHETLQRIALSGVKHRHRLELILLELAEHRLFSHMNPFAQNIEESEIVKRISMGLDKLSNTTENELVSLYEAALIRHFQPYYNRHFKNSFPSTNIKILQDCYDKDFQSIAAEICFDYFEYGLYTDKIKYNFYNKYLIHYDLHKNIDRASFFSKTK